MSLQLRDLVVTGPSGPIVTRMDLSVQPGQTVALVGESGSGKSMTAKAMTGLLPRGVTAAGTLTLGANRGGQYTCGSKGAHSSTHSTARIYPRAAHRVHAIAQHGDG